MAREEQDREDLLREATALVERAELEIDGFDAPIVVGFRRDGSVSIFFGVDPVFQFNSANQLRRGYFNGKLIKAELGRLVSLDRQRRDGQVQLLRHELSESESADFQVILARQLSHLQTALHGGSFSIVGMVPENGGVIDRFERWLDELPESIDVASTPRVK